MMVNEWLMAGAIITALAVSGCAATPSSESSSSTSERTTTNIVPDYPTPPATLDNDTLRRVALRYEETFIRRHLRNASGISSFSVGPATVTEQAVVVNRTVQGVYVEVLQPYSYEYPEGVADLSTRALYFINESLIERRQGTAVNLPRSDEDTPSG